jgi:hypothetical protein
VIAHVVLFRQQPGVTPEDRAIFANAIVRARRDIPSIRRFQLGRRVRHGRPYEQAMTQDFAYAAVVEFDDVEGLKAYLNHPSHSELARLWATTSAMTLVYDYEMGDAGDAAAILTA